jgi:hypothetical protein
MSHLDAYRTIALQWLADEKALMERIHAGEAPADDRLDTEERNRRMKEHRAAAIEEAVKLGVPRLEAGRLLYAVRDACHDLSHWRFRSGAAMQKVAFPLLLVKLAKTLRPIEDLLTAAPEPAPVSHEEEIWPDLLAVRDLAERLGVSEDAVDAFLKRHRKRYVDCYVENEGRRRNDPRFLYRVQDVLSPLREHFGLTEF